MKKLVAASVAILITVASSNLLAWDIPLIDLRLGVRGGPIISILPTVTESDPIPTYPTFFGIGWAVGGALSFDYFKMIGIEIQLLYTLETADGLMHFDSDLGTDGKKEESLFTMQNSALHLPLFVRGQLPLGIGRPFIHLGVDFVLSRSNPEFSLTQRGDADPWSEGCFRCDPFPAHHYQVSHIESSVMGLIGIGVDINAKVVTVPIEVRFLFNPNFGNSIIDRTRTQENAPHFVYNNEWQYQVLILFGANYIIF